MIVKRVVLVVWCLFSCVTCETTDVQLVNPTPVMNDVVEIRSTDAKNPLRFNKESVTVPLSTGINLLGKNGVNPTPVLPDFTTTSAANPLINLDFIFTQSTKQSDIQPTSAIHVPVVFETDAKYPLNINNMPVITASTGIIEDSFLTPTPVVKVIETTPAAVPLINDETSEVISSTGQFNIIEPSTVLKANEESITTTVTPNLEQEKPTEVLSTQPISPTLTQSVSTCTCTYYEDIKPISFDWHGHEHSAWPHFKPHGSKIKSPHPSLNIYQKYVNFHFNFFINNNPIPIITANRYPYY